MDFVPQPLFCKSFFSGDLLLFSVIFRLKPFFETNIFAHLVVELEEKLVELEGLWGKWKSHTWWQ